MSARSFRERYAATQQQQPALSEVPEEQMQAGGWPLPAGGRVERARVGECAVHDALYAGAEVAEAAALLQEAAAHTGIDPAQMRFLDTETTGLAGGTGTHVFLVGIGRFVGPTFHVRQVFMRHPGEEYGLLGHTEAALHDEATLVTFNGRTFDMPLLETRYRMHRKAAPEVETHLDLLHPARRIWRHRLASCSLGTLEREVLGVTRMRDAPGWMIPQLYFAFLRTRDIEPLEPVFSHNRMDVLSLARLTALVHAWQAGIAQPDDPTDRLATMLLRMHAHGGDTPHTLLDALREAAEDARTPALLRLRAHEECARHLKRAGRYAELLPLWDVGMRDPSRMVRQFVQEELGKYLEHRARDLEAARALVAQAHEHAARMGDLAAAAAFERRLLRIERKLLIPARAPGRRGNVSST